MYIIKYPQTAPFNPITIDGSTLHSEKIKQANENVILKA